MASSGGNWLATDDWRAIVVANITTTKNDSVTVTVQAQIQSNYVNTSYAKGRAGKAGSYGGWVSKSVSAGSTVTMTTATYAISRTHGAQNISFNAQGNIYSSGYGGSGTSTASVSLSIPARPSYTVRFDANGGSGAPGDQTKWYGETLTLSTTVPTRSGYNFAGWATSRTATSVTYSAGGKYTNNSAATLYAVWQVSYKAPSISSMSVYRCSNANGTQSDDGQYAYLNLGWEVNESGSTASAITIRYRRTTATEWTTAYTKSLTFSGTSGTAETAIYSNSNATTLVEFDTAYAYVVEVTFKDSKNYTAKTSRTLSQAYFTIDFLSGGHGVGIGHSADVENVLRIGMDVQIDGYADSSNYDRGNFACVDPRLPQNNAADVTSDTWGNGLFFYPPTDFNTLTDNPIYKSHGYIRGINLKSGQRGVQIEAQRYVNGARKTTPFNLTVDSTGIQHATLGGVDIFMTHGWVGQDTTVAANSYQNFTIEFGHTYSTAPHVIATMYSTSTSPTMGSIQVAVASVSQTGATIRIFNNTSSGRSPGFYWLAIGN